MTQQLILPFVNGGTPASHTIRCAQCNADLDDESIRCAAHSISGTKFFCKADSEHPLDSCYLAWRARHH